jgi:hypothetical protein
VPEYHVIREAADGSIEEETTDFGDELFVGKKLGGWVVVRGPDDVEGHALPVVVMREDDWKVIPGI